MSTITAAILGWILTTEAAAISGWSVSTGNIYMKSKNHYINYNSTSNMRARKKGNGLNHSTDGLVAS